MSVHRQHRPLDPAIEDRLSRNVPIIREPFTGEQLRALVTSLLEGEPGYWTLGDEGVARAMVQLHDPELAVEFHEVARAGVDRESCPSPELS